MRAPGRRWYFRGAMSGKWVRFPYRIRVSTVIERGYEVKRMTAKDAAMLNDIEERQ